MFLTFIKYMNIIPPLKICQDLFLKIYKFRADEEHICVGGSYLDSVSRVRISSAKKKKHRIAVLGGEGEIFRVALPLARLQLNLFLAHICASSSISCCSSSASLYLPTGSARLPHSLDSVSRVRISSAKKEKHRVAVLGGEGEIRTLETR